MEMVTMVAITAGVLFLHFIIKVLHETLSCYWFIPRRIKSIMEKQGVSGPPPRFLFGNLPEMAALIGKSTSGDMDSVSHDIVGRLLPHFVAWSEQHGKRFIYWNGTEPRMCLTETGMIKKLLSKYSTISGKSWQQQQGAQHFIGRGLLMANGREWYHRRHIIAPAFTGEKLKSYAASMVECSLELMGRLERSMAEKEDNEVEIGEHMTRLTADIISRTEFGGDYQKGMQIFHLLTHLQHLCAQATRRFCFPGSR
ncbi:hypothetical protein M569_01814 [Genlisea aurea]|uniref:Cytochrome P450 n=1 Tax=Genlisea aurea TaxID=192259 RepID=S8EK33_9LAMI|nr:hypothetical protein M569_01814 [Genlisea aurea]